MPTLQRVNAGAAALFGLLFLAGCAETASQAREEERSPVNHYNPGDIIYFDGDFSDLPDPPQNCPQGLTMKENTPDPIKRKHPFITQAFYSEKDQPLYSYSDAGWKGDLCSFACWGLSGVGCAAICLACAKATVITIGGAAIPCKIAILAGCGLISGGAAICDRRLCSQFGNS